MIVTVDNLDAATEQQVFDTVTSHLLKQNKKSLDEEGMCVYRNSAGLSCAAGCLITDEVYESDMENVNWNGIASGRTAYQVSKNHIGLILDLQKLHDKAPVVNWGDSFRQLAQKYGLKHEPVKV
jgi:hypothetical protein